jgi:fibronectin type 3 domain-containing protein
MTEITREKTNLNCRLHYLVPAVKPVLTALCLVGFTIMIPSRVIAAGTWTALTTAPPTGVNAAMLLSDGTVIGWDSAADCDKLTPDIHGSYINGTWTQLADMNYTRLFFASQVLTNGNIFVAGGEYGSGNTNAEIYNPLANTWTMAPTTPGGQGNVNFLDAISEILPNGNVLVAPVGPLTYGGTLIWNTASSTWSVGPQLYRGGSQDEASWVLLPDTSILTIDPFGQNSERYIPSLNQWINDANVPDVMYGYGGELGAAFLLPNGNAFYIGGTNDTAIYTPTGATSPGTWTAGPNIPDNLAAVDAPAAMLTDGNILCDLGPDGGYDGPCSFYEYNYVSNTFTQVIAPGGGSTYNSVPYANSMLDLPDGTVLFIGGQNSSSLYVYTPSGTPLAAGQPAINSITQNLDGSYHLTGTKLNGISQGAAYGDDEQMNSNYPLVRMTNSSTGNIYYARTYNWSSTGVMTGTNVVTTEFSLPANLPAGTYSLVVVANGISSAAQTFSYAPPAVPTGLSAASGSNAFVNLQWNAVSGATNYNVKRSMSSGGYFTTIATVSGAAYTNAGLTNGLTYYYEVAAVGGGGSSANSGFVSATPVGPPPVPTGLTAVGGEDALVPLTWNPSYGATNYNLMRSIGSGGPYTIIASLNATNYLDTNVNNSTTYYYVVASVGANGESQNSSQISATPLTPVIITWFRADAINGLANGTSVASWLDESGHGFTATQTTATERPAYMTNAMNSLPVVRFNSANSAYLSFSRPVQNDWTIFIVYQSSQTSQGTGTSFWQGSGLVNGDQPNTVNDFGTQLNANGQVTVGTGNPDTSISSGNGFNNGQPHVVTFKRTESTGAFVLYVDSTEAAMGTGGTNSQTAPPTLWLGAVPSGGGFFTGDIGEVKFYTSALSDVDRVAQEASLIHKWGVSLPAAPGGLTALAADGQVQLNWNAYPTATNYFVMRSTTSGGPYTDVGSTTETNYVDATVVNGTTYYYVVSAVTPYAASGNSTQVSALPTAPAVTAWFKANAIAGLANGATVASWLDASGNGFTALQLTASKRPTYVVNAMNGLPVVRFNSANSTYLSFNRPVSNDWTMLIVYQSSQTNQGTGTSFWQGAGLVNGDQPGVANDFGTQLNANGQVTVGTGNPDTAVSSGNGFNNGQPHVVTFERTESTGELALYVDGTEDATGTGGTNSQTAPPTLWLGAVPSGGGFLSGDISEVMMFNTVLSDANRAVEESMLECKYGISGNASPLATPAGLNGVWGNLQITLSWLGVSGAAGYNLSSSTNVNGPFVLLAPGVTATSYVDTNAVVGQTNYFQITAVNMCNTSPASAPVGVFLPSTSLSIASVGGVGGETIIVSWPSWAGGWGLYYSTNLAPPANWQLVTNTVANTNNQFIVNLPASSGTRFFRLQAP